MKQTNTVKMLSNKAEVSKINLVIKQICVHCNSAVEYTPSIISKWHYCTNCFRVNGATVNVLTVSQQ